MNCLDLPSCEGIWSRRLSREERLVKKETKTNKRAKTKTLYSRDVLDPCANPYFTMYCTFSCCNKYVYLQTAIISRNDKGVFVFCWFVWVVVLRFFINKNVFLVNQPDSCFVSSLLLNNTKGNVPEDIW